MNNFENMAAAQSLYETQYQQDLETLKDIISNVDSSKLTQTIADIENELAGSDQVMRHKEGILRALKLIRQLIAVENWDETLERYARKYLPDLTVISGNAGQVLDPHISDAVVVVARTVERLAQSRFPEEASIQIRKSGNPGVMTPEEELEAKKRAARMNVS